MSSELYKMLDDIPADRLRRRLQAQSVRCFFYLIYLKVVSAIAIQQGIENTVGMVSASLAAIAVGYLDWRTSSAPSLFQAVKRAAVFYPLSLVLIIAITLGFDRDYSEAIGNDYGRARFEEFVFVWAVFLLPIWLFALGRVWYASRKQITTSPTTSARHR